MSRWPRKWFVLWPSPDATKSEKDYPAKELKEHGGRWLFQFDYGSSTGTGGAISRLTPTSNGAGGQTESPLPLTVAEDTIPIAGIIPCVVPSGNDFVIELTQQGQADKIRLRTESMDLASKWMLAIATLADC